MATLKIKQVILKKGWDIVRLFRIQNNARVLYFNDGYDADRDELNAEYKKYKEREYEIIMREYTREKDAYLKKLCDAQYPYAEYCDDYKVWKHETEVNKRLSHMITRIYTEL